MERSYQLQLTTCVVVTYENLMKEGNSPEEKKSTQWNMKRRKTIHCLLTLLNKTVLIVFNRTGKNCEETSLMSEKAFEIIFTKCCQVNVNGNVDNQIVK